MKRQQPQAGPEVRAREGERGVAMVMALLVLTVLSIIVLSLVTSTAVNRRMASDDVVKTKALRIAESGVTEALNRIQNGVGPDPNSVNAAQKVVQIILAATPGTAGADTTLLSTGQAAGQWLPYSTTIKGPNALTIDFRTNAGRTQVCKYDKTLNPPIQYTSGTPIYRITSMGTVGGASRRLVVQCTMGSTYNFKGAVVSGVDLQSSVSGYNCGYNHIAAAPYPYGTTGQAGVSGCAGYETGLGDIPGVYTSGAYSQTGSGVNTGNPALVSGTGVFYTGPWDVFGMTQSAFWSWVGAPVSKPAVLNGVYYVDNDATKQNQSCNISYTSPITGSGFLYVDGDLTLSNNFHFTGLVYCEGDLTVSNGTWVLGSIIAKGRTASHTTLTGPNTFLFSSGAIQVVPGAPATGSTNKVQVLSWQEN